MKNAGLISFIIFYSVVVAAEAFNAENELIAIEWSGGKAFVQKLEKSGKNPCDFLRQKIKENNEFTVRRVVLAATETRCTSEKVSLIRKNLKAADPMLVANTIDLVGSLESKNRKEFTKALQTMRNRNQDFAVQRALDKFFSK